MRSLLFLSHRFPYPPNKGEKIRGWHVLEHLAQSWRVHLGCLVDDPADPLGVLDLTTHTAPLDQAPAMYEKFQKKEDGCIKVVLKP